MKVIRSLVFLLAGGASFYGQSVPAAAEREVAVCFNHVQDSATVRKARTITHNMFSEIGVNIDWQLGLHDCPANAIIITMNRNTPATLRPGALAYTKPYDGVHHIKIFYDRVSQYGHPVIVSVVLAHVLAHEIAHILQGVAQHSEGGIMKTHWDEHDLFRMKRKPLKFTQHDIDLIDTGLTTYAHDQAVTGNRSEPVIARRY